MRADPRARARKDALKAVVAGNDHTRLAASKLRRIATDGLTDKEWSERYMARANGEKVPPTRELTTAQWREIERHLRNAIGQYSAALGVAEQEANRA